MNVKKSLNSNPIYWSILIFIFAQIITFCVISQENAFLNNNEIYIPPQQPDVVSIWPQPTTSPSGEVTQTPVYSSLGPILIYFLAVVIILGIVLFLIPLSALRLLLRALFAFVFGWAVFIILIFWVPLPATIILATAVGLSWFFVPRVWLHNLALVLAMTSVGVVFGRLLSPWTAMILLVAISVYDFLAVRFGYMLWMAGKMSDSNTLPAFFIPKAISEWRHSLKELSVTKLADQNPAERKYSILGGGDIGFPLLLVSSVFFAFNFYSAIIVAVFSLLGLIGAYLIQARFLKGKAMPALPPIAVLSLVGLLIVNFA
jgi:presenilin-like A22 family membrane protease